MENSYTTCSQCRTGAARIITKAGFKCWKCYHGEQKMFKTEDWRDKTINDYAANNDMVLRDGETLKNLANRCKRLAIEGLKKLK